jgi:hypothetical protein
MNSTLTQAIAEALRQVILVLVLFEIVNWTDTQIAGTLSAVSAVLTAITVAITIFKTVPISTANHQIETAVDMPKGTTVAEVLAAAKANKKEGE